ncbi:MAG TPA: DUF5615 family PIN-like protein [Phycisphaerae bacterium]|nr:DUF5615 family PIN-like protein [Phycisphaerae bacterium]
MRFLIHGQIFPDAIAALEKQEHAAHQPEELGEESDVESPSTLLPLLQKNQWNLLTTDTDFINELYEWKLPFNGVIVLLLDSDDGPHQAAAIDRLFERYNRLTPRRLYTVTPSRVKIRQLPGAGQA